MPDTDLIADVKRLLADIEQQSHSVEDRYRAVYKIPDDGEDEVLGLIADVTDEVWALRVLIDSKLGPPYEMDATKALLEPDMTNVRVLTIEDEDE